MEANYTIQITEYMPLMTIQELYVLLSTIPRQFIYIFDHFCLWNSSISHMPYIRPPTHPSFSISPLLENSELLNLFFRAIFLHQIRNQILIPENRHYEKYLLSNNVILGKFCNAAC